MTMHTVRTQVTLLGAALALLVGFGVAHATTYTVTTACDDTSPTMCTGTTLRDAITSANADGMTDTIDFNIPSSDPGCPSANVCSGATGSPQTVGLSATVIKRPH